MIDDNPFTTTTVTADVVVTPTVSEQDVVDSHAAAAILGVTLNNLRQMVFKKKLAVVGKAGRRVTFLRSDVEALKSTRHGS